MTKDGDSKEDLSIRVVTYSFSRLCFLAEKIEPLRWEDAFQVDTPVGTFRMSKRQFRETFPNVVASRSYRENGIYHYPTAPQKAMKYKIN